MTLLNATLESVQSAILGNIAFAILILAALIITVGLVTQKQIEDLKEEIKKLKQ
jgi:hypothetical protein